MTSDAGKPSGESAPAPADDGRLPTLVTDLRAFVRERNWEQFHTPKNLAMALAVEASELMEHFQWLTEKESANLDQATLTRVRQEIGDVMIYLLRLCDVLSVDPLSAAIDKVDINRRKYPADRVRGSAKKHDQY